MDKDSKMALAFGGVAVGLLVLFFMGSANGSSSSDLAPDGAISIENGVQIIDLTANGGYSPSRIVAQAGVPTELHVATNSTYDCSASLVIPSLGYRKMLKPTGTEVILLTADQAKGDLEGMCSMGMYSFEITFR